LTEDFDLYTKLPELLALLGSQSFSLPLVYLRLLDPTPKSVVRDSKLPGDLGSGFVSGRADQPNGLCSELWCIAWCCSWHLWGSFGRHSHRKLWCVRRPESSPPTLKAASEALGALAEEKSVHLDRGYDSKKTRERLGELGLGWEISGKGKPAPYWVTIRWVVERTSSWHNAHKKLLWCTERVGKVIDFWVAFSDVVIIVRRLVREG
jgi:hypothetical protein